MEEPLLPLIRAVVAGDAAAWQALVAALVPRIEAIARAHEAMRARGLAGLPDDVAEVKAAALERLAASGYKNLARWLEQRERGGDAAQSFDSWLYGAVDFTVREHLRRRFGRARGAAPALGGPRPSKRELGTHAERLDEERLDRSFVHTLGMTAKLAVAEIFAHVDAHFSARDARALRLYYSEDQSLAEIAATLGLPDAGAADKLIRKLNARLRYKFGGG